MHFCSLSSWCSHCAPAADPTEAPAEATPEATEAHVVSEETAAVLSKWTDDLYEPETSITYSATIVWPADASAVETAAQDVRPNTMIVAVDENLTVSTLDGEVLPENLAEYLASVKPTTLPALYIRDDATAAAVNAFAAEYSLADTFVVADYEHTQYLRTSAMQTSAFSVSSTGVKPSSAPSAARTPSLTMTPKRIIKNLPPRLRQQVL